MPAIRTGLVSVLDLKLWRSIATLQGQLAALILIIGAGVATWVLSQSVVNALQRSQAQMYQESHFADIFARVTRAPDHIANTIRQWNGVQQVEERLIAQARLQLPVGSAPVTLKLISLPESPHSGLNQVYLRQGHWPHPERAEVLLSESFAKARHLKPGDRLEIIIHGQIESFMVSGVGLSPEYIYSLGPGALFPDDHRYGVIWLNRKRLAGAIDMQGAFNDLSLTLNNQVNPLALIEKLDLLLADYGGIGAIRRDKQLSHHFLTQEIKGLETTGFLLPVIFLAVAAFVLYLLMNRMIERERDQIALLKACGYQNKELIQHYFKWVVCLTSLGVVLGIVIGWILGYQLGQFYLRFFHFPFLLYHLDYATGLSAWGVSLAATTSGSLSALLKVVALPPALAMQPEAPPVFRQSCIERLLSRQLLSLPIKMIIRHLTRRPWQNLLTITGLSLALAITLLGGFQKDAVDELLRMQFQEAQRETLSVSFNDPVAYRALYEMQQIAGVEQIEPFRSTPVKIRYQHRQQETTLLGLVQNPVLHRVLDSNHQPLVLPQQGLVLNDYLAHKLGIQLGDSVSLEVLSGAKPQLNLPVVATIADPMGMTAYIWIQPLNRLLNQGTAIDGVYLAVSSNHIAQIIHTLNQRAKVAFIQVKAMALQSAQETIAESLLIFTLINTALAVVIAFGVVYNNIRITYSERSRDLACLSVLGLERSQLGFILLGELAVLIVTAIPLGFVLGRVLCAYLVEAMASELYRIPLVIQPSSYLFSAAIIFVSGLAGSWTVWKRLQSMNPAAVLKTRD